MLQVLRSAEHFAPSWPVRLHLHVSHKCGDFSLHLIKSSMHHLSFGCTESLTFVSPHVHICAGGTSWKHRGADPDPPAPTSTRFPLWTHPTQTCVDSGKGRCYIRQHVVFKTRLVCPLLCTVAPSLLVC